MKKMICVLMVVLIFASLFGCSNDHWSVISRKVINQGVEINPGEYEYKLTDFSLPNNHGDFYVGYLPYKYDEVDYENGKTIYIKEEYSISLGNMVLYITSYIYYSGYNGFDHKIIVKYNGETFEGTDGRLFYYYYREPHIVLHYDTSKGKIHQELYDLLVAYQLQFIQDAYLALEHFTSRYNIKAKWISGINFSEVDFSLYY